MSSTRCCCTTAEQEESFPLTWVMQQKPQWVSSDLYHLEVVAQIWVDQSSLRLLCNSWGMTTIWHKCQVPTLLLPTHPQNSFHLHMPPTWILPIPAPWPSRLLQCTQSVQLTSVQGPHLWEEVSATTCATPLLMRCHRCATWHVDDTSEQFIYFI